MTTIVQRFIAAVNREYERRVARVSQPAEEPPHTSDDHEEWEDGAVEIANIPRGTVVDSKMSK